MKNRLDVAVSYYEHIYTKFPVRATLIDLLTTNRYKSRVLAVRTESDARKKKELKTRLPAFTPSGLFRGGAANTLLKPTGLICIDIDRKDNLQVEGYDRLKDQLGRLPPGRSEWRTSRHSSEIWRILQHTGLICAVILLI